jgi:hypothetical protein
MPIAPHDCVRIVCRDWRLPATLVPVVVQRKLLRTKSSRVLIRRSEIKRDNNEPAPLHHKSGLDVDGHRAELGSIRGLHFGHDVRPTEASLDKWKYHCFADNFALNGSRCHRYQRSDAVAYPEIALRRLPPAPQVRGLQS